MLAADLGRYGIETVVLSEEPKARETAEIFAEQLGVDVSVSSGLHEHDRTGAPFLSSEEFESTAQAFFEQPDQLIWGNETAQQARKRFSDALRRALDGEKTIAIVAHGTVISLFVAQHNGVPAHELWSSLSLPSFCILSLPGFELQEVVSGFS